MKIIVVSGFFNPLHGGHLDMIEAAASMADKLVVIVNNDIQQTTKKGKVILSENNRSRLIAALRVVDEVVIASDEDMTVCQSLRDIAVRYKGNELLFANGGDRSSTQDVPETSVCNDNSIQMLFGVGGHDKADSSTRINQAFGHVK